jgi:hypothetical protein
VGRRTRTGRCQLCGQLGQLSFEHVPPRAAFNDRKVTVWSGDQLVNLGPGELPPGQGHHQQRGAGNFTLCVRCNNDTGAWYVPQFVRWCYQGMDVLQRTSGRPSLIYLYRIQPLAVLKQVVTMFASLDPGLMANQSDLRRFVLNRRARPLPPRVRCYAYFSFEGVSRSVGVAAHVQLDRGNTTLLSEMNFPPFGYVLTIDSLPPDPRLADISHFDQYLPDELAIKELRMTALPTHLPYPGDYRTRSEIEEQRLASTHAPTLRHD